jgi:hypothetical protein
VGSVTEARRGDPLPSPSWGSEASALEGMKQGGFPDDPAVEAVNLAVTELTAALVLLLLNKFLLPPSL